MTQRALFPERPKCQDCGTALADFIIDGQALCSACCLRRYYPQDPIPDPPGDNPVYRFMFGPR